MWLPESPRNCYDPHETKEEVTPKNLLQEETQMKGDPLEGDPSEKIHQTEADHPREDHPLEEDYLSA